MQLENRSQELLKIINSSVEIEYKKWFDSKLDKILIEKSRKELYLTYSLIATKIKETAPDLVSVSNNDLIEYLQVQKGTTRELLRIYLFVKVLEADSDFFSPLVANIIQVADTSELVTFLKFLLLLPNPDYYSNTAVDALRTNIATVFDAIALKNPYPSLYFTTPQWNQMYLKAAFMERDLMQIVNIDKMANKELAKIISDYAHERWEAGRTVTPYFWRPMANFIDDELIKDMEHLFGSDTIADNYAAALCCYKSDYLNAKNLLKSYPELVKKLENNEINWETITQYI